MLSAALGAAISAWPIKNALRMMNVQNWPNKGALEACRGEIPAFGSILGLERSQNSQGKHRSFCTSGGCGRYTQNLKNGPFIINRRNAQKHAKFANFGHPSDTVQKVKSWPLDPAWADPMVLIISQFR